MVENKKTKKTKPKPKPKPKPKSKENKVVVQIDGPKKEDDPVKYCDKLRHLLNKIKSQHNFVADKGIRFAWK